MHHRPANVANVVALKPVTLGDQGGGETHTLTEAELPAYSSDIEVVLDIPLLWKIEPIPGQPARNVHSGETFISDRNDGITPFTGPRTNGDPVTALNMKFVNAKDRIFAVRQNERANAAHNNMPPYIALHFCKKEE